MELFQLALEKDGKRKKVASNIVMNYKNMLIGLQVFLRCNSEESLWNKMGLSKWRRVSI